MIYISHRLEEIFALADRVTVLRDGESVGTRWVRESPLPPLPSDGRGGRGDGVLLTPSELIQMMIGRAASVGSSEVAQACMVPSRRKSRRGGTIRFCANGHGPVSRGGFCRSMPVGTIETMRFLRQDSEQLRSGPSRYRRLGRPPR